MDFKVEAAEPRVVLTGLTPEGKRREKSRLVTSKACFGFISPGSTRHRWAACQFLFLVALDQQEVTSYGPTKATLEKTGF